MKKIITGMFIIAILYACKIKTMVDLIVKNAVVYTVDSTFSCVEAFAVKDGKFVATGTNTEICSKYHSKRIIDLNGKAVYPGFIDAHSHFYGYAKALLWLDLKGTKSFDEIIDIIKAHTDRYKSKWILGRGWDQNNWQIKKFPNKIILDSLFPDIPVFLERVDGHAALVNSAALKLAGINNTTKVNFGEIQKDTSGKLTGILIDNAMTTVMSIIPEPSLEEKIKVLKQAQENCFKTGLTTVTDAGQDKNIIELYDSLQKQGVLKIKLYVMLNPTKENFEKYLYNGRYKTERLNICAIKLFSDGALGSRGACLLKPYNDDTGNYGLLASIPYLKENCKIAYKYNYQVNTHAIGDSAVRTVLKIYGEILGGKNERRWRIEHSQLVDSQDFQLYAKYSIIPSVNTIHAISDMYWAEDRLGKQRIKNAYAYKRLLEQNGWLANGSDFPVENINPLYGFYAAVARKDLNAYPPQGFQKENALTREQALRAMTIWAAKAEFTEHEKGSIQPGKYADFVVTDQDIMKVQENKIPKTKVLYTFIMGQEVYVYNK